MASFLRRNDDLRRLRARQMVLQYETGDYPTQDAVLRFVDLSGNIGESGIFVDDSGNLIVTGSADVSGDLSVGGSVDVSGNLTVDGSGGFGGSVDISGDLTVDGSGGFGGSVDISGDLTVDGSGNIGGDLSVGGDLTVDGSGNIGGDLSVGGDLTVDGSGGFGGSVDISGDLTVDGSGGFGGSVDVSGDLTVDGSGNIGGDLSVGGDLTVDGSGGFGGSVDISGDLTVDGSGGFGGSVDISGDLTVDGSGGFGGSVDISGNLYVYGLVSASGDVISNSGLSRLSTNEPNVGSCEVYSVKSDSVGPQFQSFKSRGSGGAVITNDELGRVNFFGQDASGAYGNLAAVSIQTYAAGDFTPTSHPASLLLATCPSGGILALDRLIITEAGNVGIGTITPKVTLDVVGDISASGIIYGTRKIIDTSFSVINVSAGDTLLSNPSTPGLYNITITYQDLTSFERASLSTSGYWNGTIWEDGGSAVIYTLASETVTVITRYVRPTNDKTKLEYFTSGAGGTIRLRYFFMGVC